MSVQRVFLYRSLIFSSRLFFEQANVHPEPELINKCQTCSLVPRLLVFRHLHIHTVQTTAIVTRLDTYQCLLR